ncbi:DUF1837 domain-containing protein [Mucilaginibacter lutimaris]|uniref:DUF1837 domain-containing protein n=1 Tax=Mucilaginibacter lutimaris TaxID=931629 RepID=A0ABW2ZI71_9SPHI
MSLSLNFKILIDDSFINIATDKSLNPIDKKNVLSVINDFEDKKWRYKNFQNFIWDNVAETSLSYNERESLIDSSHSLLTAAAQNLRLTDKIGDISKGSELAEIALYGIMKHHYNALPVVPKIFYKQNVQDNAKGADSVHIVIESDYTFSIWLGEAKFYNSIDDARFDVIVESIENALVTDKLKKENSIITNVSDIDGLITDVELRKKIKLALNGRKSIDDLKPILHIPILLLHECAITNKCISLSDDYKAEITDLHKVKAETYFKKQLTKLSAVNKYASITFHLILFPVPSKEAIVNSFLSTANFYKNS